MSSRSQSSGNFESHYCYCGVECPVVTSWSDLNPERRFYSCGNYGKAYSCNYFTWLDSPMQPQAKRVILGLLRKIERIEMERERERERIRRRDLDGGIRPSWKKIVIMMVAIIGIVVWGIQML